MSGRRVLAAVVAVVILAMAQAAQATESWVTDAKTGAKVGWVSDSDTLTAASWSGPLTDGKADGAGTLLVSVRTTSGESVTGQLEAEMAAGRLHGKVRARWSNGDAFEGFYADGRMDGKGIYKWASRGGRVYQGEFRNGLYNGHGVYREASGKVLYEGQWVDGVPATRPNLDKVLGVAWGASEDEVKKAMLARPGTALRYAWKEGPRSVQQYWGPFNGRDHWLFFRFNEGRLYAVAAHFSAPEAQLDMVMERLEQTRRGMAERYGPPDDEQGKYLDAKLAWYWPGKYAIRLAVERQSAPVPGFGMWLWYTDVPATQKAEGQKAAAAKSDY